MYTQHLLQHTYTHLLTTLTTHNTHTYIFTPAGTQITPAGTGIQTGSDVISCLIHKESSHLISYRFRRTSLNPLEKFLHINK